MTEDQAFPTPSIRQEVPGLHGDKILLLDWDNQPPTFCNLIRVDENGESVWRITPIFAQQGVYSGVQIKDGHIIAYNMDGYLDTIDYNTGKVIQRKFVK